jgi:malonyl-CoA O-methyltransferase
VQTPSQYTGAVTGPAPTTQRLIDEPAVASVHRRLARLPAAPWLHAEVAARMAERLALFRVPPRRIVDWSSFLGASASLLAAAHPHAELIAVEPTDALVERSLAALRAPWWNRLPWSAAAARVLSTSAALPTEVQLVWANLALNGVTDPPALIQQWHQMLSAGGYVMFSCFGPDTVRELRPIYAQLGGVAPTIDFVDMHDLGDMLLRAGFVDPVMDQETLKVQWDDAASMLRDLRLLGGNVSPQRFAGLRTPQWRVGLHRLLDGIRDDSGRLGLTFEVAYGHAFKAVKTTPTLEPTQVSVEEMRRLLRAARKSP